MTEYQKGYWCGIMQCIEYLLHSHDVQLAEDILHTTEGTKADFIEATKDPIRVTRNFAQLGVKDE